MSDAERVAATPGAEALDIIVAHPARVYDAWLGGKDHFTADRQAGRPGRQDNPEIMPSVRANRAFLARAVRYLVREAGVHQFLDLGTGLPSAEQRPRGRPGRRPRRPRGLRRQRPDRPRHARALLTGTPGTAPYIDADIRDVREHPGQAHDTLDFTKPIGVMPLMILQFVPDADDPYALVRRFMPAVPSGKLPSSPALRRTKAPSASRPRRGRPATTRWSPRL